MAVMSRDEDDRRRVFQDTQVARQLDPAHARHVDVEQQHLRPAPGQPLERVQAILRLAGDFAGELIAQIGDQLAHARARERLVVHDEYAQRKRHGASARQSARSVM